jgi:hypothetical protein
MHNNDDDNDVSALRLSRKCRAKICRKPEENKKKKLTYSIMKQLATNAKR